MNIRIESNARIGRGFQLQWNHGPISKTYARHVHDDLSLINFIMDR